jgi:hypothetical protein
MKLLLTFLIFASILASFSLTSAWGQSTNQSLPDLSGIAWIEDDTFFPVHDANFPDEAATPRASLFFHSLVERSSASLIRIICYQVCFDIFQYRILLHLRLLL